METKYGSTKVIETPVYVWHMFSTGTGTPIVVVPPHAGRDWTISLNLIKVAVQTGRPVVAFELKSATWMTNNTSVSDLVNAIGAIHEFLGVDIEIVGLCQGGWVSSIYTAQNPDNVKKLAVFVAPINTNCAPDNLIEKHMRKPFVVEMQRMVVMMNLGLQLGALQWLAFSMVDPHQIYVQRHLDRAEMVRNSDEVGLAKWDKNNAWYDNKLDLAGVWFMDALENLFRDNRLYDGTWRVNGKLVKLESITCPTHCYAGRTDNITDSRQVLALADKVSGPSFKYILEGGHTAGWTGRKGLQTFKETFLL